MASDSTKSYAGIGARSTPQDVLFEMSKIGARLEAMGWTLRSGGAKGADKAFEKFVAPVNKQIYTVHDNTKESLEMAKKFHPAPHRLKGHGLHLMARNSFQVLGPDLSSPSEFVLCWTPNGLPVGGTSQAIRIAESYGVPVYNLAKQEDRKQFYKEYL